MKRKLYEKYKQNLARGVHPCTQMEKKKRNYLKGVFAKGGIGLRRKISAFDRYKSYFCLLRLYGATIKIMFIMDTLYILQTGWPKYNETFRIWKSSKCCAKKNMNIWVYEEKNYQKKKNYRLNVKETLIIYWYNHRLNKVYSVHLNNIL